MRFTRCPTRRSIAVRPIRCAAAGITDSKVMHPVVANDKPALKRRRCSRDIASVSLKSFEVDEELPPIRMLSTCIEDAVLIEKILIQSQPMVPYR